jgi:dipeptidase E
MKKRLLLISNSTNYGEEYLGWPKNYIKEFLDKKGIKRVLFIPYAGIALSYDGIEASYEAYEQRVNAVFNTLGLEIYSIHHENEPAQAIKDALAIAVGGGNTFHLVHQLHQLRLMKVIKEAVESGTSFLGWSAGANVACPTMRTTNDMPIIEPESMNCLSLVPFQINPHYLDVTIEGHGGETREQRIEEFMVVNSDVFVVGLREGTLLSVENHKIELIGARPARIFKAGMSPKEIAPGGDLSFLR